MKNQLVGCLMTFEEWWEREVSARRVDETDAMRGVAYAAWRTAFEAGAVGLRDKFAMVALQGLLADNHLDGTVGDFGKWAYKIADAILKERVK